MTRIFKFIRSDLFLSLIGGFALGVAGLAVVKPANAVVGANAGKSVSIGAIVDVPSSLSN